MKKNFIEQEAFVAKINAYREDLYTLVRTGLAFYTGTSRYKEFARELIIPRDIGKVTDKKKALEFAGIQIRNTLGK